MLLLDFEIAARFGRVKAALWKRPLQREMIEMCRRAARGEQISFAQLFTARRYASRTLFDAVFIPFVLWLPALTLVGTTVSSPVLLLSTTLFFVGMGFILMLMSIVQNFRFTALRRMSIKAGVDPASPQAEELARSHAPRQLDVWLPTLSVALICTVIDLANAVNRA